MAELDAGTLKSLVAAGRLSTLQLERICQAYFAQSLTLISGASTPDQQAEDMIAYAIQYHLTRELASGLLAATVESPAVQNLLLSDTNLTPEPNGTNGNYNLMRLENRLDRIGEKLDAIDRRLAVVESAQTRPATPPNNTDRLFVLALSLLLALAMLYTLFTNGGPQ